jgi:hypothetical protein
MPLSHPLLNPYHNHTICLLPPRIKQLHKPIPTLQPIEADACPCRKRIRGVAIIFDFESASESICYISKNVDRGKETMVKEIIRQEGEKMKREEKLEEDDGGDE